MGEGILGGKGRGVNEGAEKSNGECVCAGQITDWLWLRSFGLLRTPQDDHRGDSNKNKIWRLQSLLEFGVFGFGLEEDGDVGVGIFPECEEILIGGAGFSGVVGEDGGAGEAEVRERVDVVADRQS
jgi:hypothetical protein